MEKDHISDSGSQASNSKKDSEIEVLCACDAKYLPHAATMLCSLLEHNSICRIHLFYSSVEERELAKMKSLVARYETKIASYKIEPADFTDLRVDKWASPAVYYRFLAPRLLPTDVKKVLYLDLDIIVRGSLKNLWNTDLTGCALAAVPDLGNASQMALGLPTGAKYFNSGVLLINLQFWRQNSVPERAIAFARENPEKVQYWDQDALNGSLVDKWCELPAYWNWLYWSRPSEHDTEEQPAIVHFHGQHKPWHWSNTHPFRQEYRKYRGRTPWPYREEGVPALPRRLARIILPNSLRRWLRSWILSTQA